MEVYAAQVTAMDRGICRIVAALEDAGELDDTIFLFLSDNGGCAEGQGAGYMDEVRDRIDSMRVRTRTGEWIYRGNVPEVMPGPETTYGSYGRAWANLSNTPFREYKHWVHERGIATPLVVHWPAGIAETGVVRRQPFQLPDVLATVLDATGVDHPDIYPGRDPLPPEGRSMLDAWCADRADPDHTLYWEHEGNAAVRRGGWKLVRKYPGDWELYDIDADRTETRDRAAQHPGTVAELARDYQAWADRCGVLPRDHVIAVRDAHPSWIARHGRA